MRHFWAVIATIYSSKLKNLICFGNQWTGFYMIEASVMKGLHSVRTQSLELQIQDYRDIMKRFYFPIENIQGLFK